MNTFKKYLSYYLVLSVGVMIGLAYGSDQVKEGGALISAEVVETVEVAEAVPSEDVPAPEAEALATDPAGAVVDPSQIDAGVDLEYLAMVAPVVKVLRADYIGDLNNYDGIKYHLYDYDNNNYYVNYDLYDGAHYILYLNYDGSILGYEVTDLPITGGIDI